MSLLTVHNYTVARLLFLIAATNVFHFQSWDQGIWKMTNLENVDDKKGLQVLVVISCNQWDASNNRPHVMRDVCYFKWCALTTTGDGRARTSQASQESAVKAKPLTAWQQPQEYLFQVCCVVHVFWNGGHSVLQFTNGKWQTARSLLGL